LDTDITDVMFLDTQDKKCCCYCNFRKILM